VTNTVTTIRPACYPDLKGITRYDPVLEPYASLFLKPLTNKKSTFSKKELAVMCKDPLHSPRLILYLIDCVKEL
jgi:hypothetical protein